MDSMVQHILEIEKTQARLEEKIDALAEQVSRLCEKVDAHATTLSQQTVLVNSLRDRTSDLEFRSKEHQTAIDKAAGARIVLNALTAFVGAVLALLGQHFWR